jgi:uncharacterized phiE125 gp8 family phage protein
MIIPKKLDKDGHMVWKVTINPLVEPVTLEEIKLFARIDGDTENSLLNSLIVSARILTENYLNRALIEQTITARMDYWPGDEVVLPRPPLLSVISIQTLDENDTASTYSSDNYFLDSYNEPGKVIIKDGVEPPQNTERYQGGFQIIYKAGYGDSAADVPETIKTCIKQLITQMYENRAVFEEPPTEIKGILDSYRIDQI